MANWVKKTPYGDYRNTEDNNKKHDMKHECLVNRGLRSGISHAGSKTHHTLKQYK